MVLVMAWCLRNKYQFQLFSKNANFGYDKGWNDYFSPFCTEVYNDFHLQYNLRPLRQIKYYPIYEKVLYGLRLHNTNFAYTPFFHRLKKKFGFGKFLTQDVFDKARRQRINEVIEIPKLEFNGNLRNLCKLLTEITWNFNTETQFEINKLITELDLPQDYIGLHIRGGDKWVEYKQMPISLYIKKAEKICESRNAFVLTDDYRIISELKTTYPTWQFYTLCQTNEKGYYFNEFQRLETTEKKERHIRLFASMLLLEQACHFVGTYSSNPGMFLGMHMPPEKCHGVDFPEWRIW